MDEAHLQRLVQGKHQRDRRAGRSRVRLRRATFVFKQSMEEVAAPDRASGRAPGLPEGEGLEVAPMNESNRPLRVEIVAYAPTAFYHCTHCEVVWQQTGFSQGLHAEQVKSALPPEMQRDYQAVSDWARHLLQIYCDQVEVRVIDAVSIEGMWKSVRHGLTRYPAVIVGGRRFLGADFSAAEAEIARQLSPVPA